MAIAFRMLKLTLFSLCTHIALTQRPPPNGCSSVFHYHRQGDRWIGLLTPTEDGLRSVNWAVRFMAHSVNVPGKVSNLAPYPDEQTALQHMHVGGRAQCFVRFEGYGDELPKVVHVELNGQVLCSDSEYDAPASTSTRELHMSVSSTTSYKMAESRPNPPSATTSTAKKPVTYARRAPAVGSNVDQYSGNPFLRLTTSRQPGITVDMHQNPAASECGVEGFVGLQIGGETLPRGRFPWLAALYHDSNLDPNKIELAYKCVTTLISARTVITAAHCIFGFTPVHLRVYVGRHDISVHPERDATLMTVESVRTHPDYVGNLVPDSDVGLLVLTEQVQFSTYVRPICLWSSSTSVSIDDSEQSAVAGWGIDGNFKQTRFPVTVIVRSVSREECLREMVTAKDFLTPRTLCAGNSQGHGPCLGDSGGGLMVLRKTRWFVRGIVSLAQRAGNGCDLSRYVIYCDVARHLNWIERNIVS